jgi:hypothetical protein
MINHYLRPGVAVAMAGISACVTLPAPSVGPRPAVAIAASVEKTWASALDQLAEQGITIRTVDRNAGFIATETIGLPLFSKDPGTWADCGTFAGFRYAPTVVDYSIFVRGNITASSMTTRARYRLLKSADEVPTDCVSTGISERSFDASTKQRAELTR